MTPARRGQARRTFGRTWWGGAWIETLEERARLDRNRLARGRTYLRQGRVGQLTVERGEVRAGVKGRGDSRYLVRVGLRRLTDAEWERVLDALAAQAGHAAALLDGELPPAVVGDVADAGIDLLPGPGDVRLRCTCPDWAEPCKHAAAVSYLVAEVLDADPFALLLLRGRSRHEVLEGLRARRAVDRRRDGDRDAPAGAGRAADMGVEARLVFAKWEHDGPVGLPPVPLPPRHPGHPAPLGADPPPGSGVRASDLAELASGAARLAWGLLSGDDTIGPSGGPVEAHVAWWERPLSEAERRTATVASAWFHELRTLPLPRSFALVAVQALYEAGALITGLHLDDLATRSQSILGRSANLAPDLDSMRPRPALSDRRERREWWRRRGLAPWVEPASGRGRFFSIEGDRVVPHLPCPPGCEEELCDMTLDVVLERLARYQSR